MSAAAGPVTNELQGEAEGHLSNLEDFLVVRYIRHLQSTVNVLQKDLEGNEEEHLEADNRAAEKDKCLLKAEDRRLCDQEKRNALEADDRRRAGLIHYRDTIARS